MIGALNYIPRRWKSIKHYYKYTYYVYQLHAVQSYIECLPRLERMPFQKPSTSKSTHFTRRQRGRHADVPKPLQGTHERSAENQAKGTTNGGVNDKKSMSGYKQIRKMRYDFGILYDKKKGDGTSVGGVDDEDDNQNDFSDEARLLSPEQIDLLSKTTDETDYKGEHTTVSGQLLGVGAVLLIILVVAILAATGTI